MSMQHALRKARYRPDRRRSGPPEPKQEVPKLPSSYLEVDEDKQRYLRSAFVAKNSIDPLARQLGQARLTTGQLRRFFNHCRQIERRLRTEGESWEQVSAKFHALSSHAQYARSAGKIPREFTEFIDANVQRVETDNNPCEAFLRGFMPHFEALVGFAAAYLREA